MARRSRDADRGPLLLCVGPRAVMARRDRGIDLNGNRRFDDDAAGSLAQDPTAQRRTAAGGRPANDIARLVSGLYSCFCEFRLHVDSVDTLISIPQTMRSIARGGPARRALLPMPAARNGTVRRQVGVEHSPSRAIQDPRAIAEACEKRRGGRPAGSDIVGQPSALRRKRRVCSPDTGFHQ